MINKVVSIITFSDEYLSGRLSQILDEDNCIELVFRDGNHGLIDIRDIKFCTPLPKQPEVVV